MPSTQTHLHTALLSSREILEEFLTEAPPDAQKILSKSFITARRRTEYRPDYVYKKTQSRIYGEKPSHSHILLRAINDLSETYLRSNGKGYVVQTEIFNEWQHLITKVSPLLLTSAAIISDCNNRCFGKPEEIVLDKISHSSLPTMDCRILDDMLAKRGLAELHMHLNGTTEADKVWLDALERPDNFVSSLKEAFGVKIEEQLQQTSHFLHSAFDVYKLLITAAVLRQYLAKAVFDNERESYMDLRTVFSQDTFIGDKQKQYSFKTHPTIYHFPADRKYKPLAHEGKLLVLTLKELESGDEYIARIFHCYLLIQSCFNSLLIQQQNQCGFDQFQRIADNKLRDPSEKDYEYRFHQIAHHMPGDQCHIEGRFAPKGTHLKNKILLDQIVAGWKNHKDKDPNSNPQKRELSLTAHFIKKEDKHNHPLYRHHKIRQELLMNSMRLHMVQKANSNFKTLITSADAAANELHAGPEVFAPAFRLLRAKGCKNFTYHVGEDFHHLASGLRAIWEAVTFLELSSGDRIGHGTALGISPSLWHERIGGEVIVTRQEWLDTLLFVYDQLRTDKEYGAVASQFADYAREHANLIYHPERRPSLIDLIAGWKMRHLDPLIIFKSSFGTSLPITPWRQREEQLAVQHSPFWDRDKSFDFEAVERLKETEPFKALRDYHEDKNIRENGEQPISVSSDQIPLDIISVLQNKVIKLLNDRQVAMEVMPTSNLRISLYEDYGEHHIFRLLGCEDSNISERPTMCIASDDPGIFATCLRNEYAHVYRELRQKGYSERKALAEIEHLIDNAWAFRFKAEEH
ncbi:hypothetical protein [Maridesulfovibrio sp.]|uniref:hypothetical protein n=1 Tax=Maridesulfovibrio sp. TaxID=2795000 RepID=UPI0029C9B813|nr:hypothetical protein [Maridesulfovibrio sp.]